MASQVERNVGEVPIAAVTAEDAWARLKSDAGSVLVDVRTIAEWAYVGLPELSTLGKRPVLVEWQSFAPATPESGGKPRMVANQSFAKDLERAGVSKDAPVVFLCRSGGRSRSV